MDVKEFDLFEGLPDVASAEAIVEAKPAELLPPKGPDSYEEKRRAKLQSIEDEILKETMTIIGDSLKFRDIDAGEKGIPDEWVRDGGLTPQEAAKRLRVANLAHLPPKEAPVALHMAPKIMVGIIKARATEKQAPRSLNINLQAVSMKVVLPSFPEVKVER